MMLHLSPAVTLSQIRVWQQPVHRWPLTTHTNTGASLRPTSSLFYCYLVKHSQLFCSPRPPKPSYRLTERRSEILPLVVIRSLDVVWIRQGKKKITFQVGNDRFLISGCVFYLKWEARTQLLGCRNSRDTETPTSFEVWDLFTVL